MLNTAEWWKQTPPKDRPPNLRLVGEHERTDWTRNSQRPWRFDSRDGTGEYPVCSRVAAAVIADHLAKRSESHETTDH